MEENKVKSCLEKEEIEQIPHRLQFGFHTIKVGQPIPSHHI